MAFSLKSLNLENIGEKLNDTIGKGYIFVLIILFVTLYGPRLSPSLPDPIRHLFGNQIFRTLIVFVIIFNSNRKLGLVMSLFMAILFMFAMNMLQMSSLMEHMESEKKESQGTTDMEIVKELKKLQTMRENIGIETTGPKPEEAQDAKKEEKAVANKIIEKKENDKAAATPASDTKLTETFDKLLSTGIIGKEHLSALNIKADSIKELMKSLEQGHKEHFVGSQPGISPTNCEAYDLSKATAIGYPFYPLN